MTKIGILGGGQLGKMLASAAAELGLQVLIYDDKPDSCAFATERHICASFDDAVQLKEFANSCDLITCEFENIPLNTLKLVNRTKPCLPNIRAFQIGSNRLEEKSYFTKIGLLVPPYASINSADQAAAAVDKIGLPLIAKTIGGGYDGKGQQICSSQQQLEQWCLRVNKPAIAEKLVDFDHELSIIIARNQAGETIAYPPACVFQYHGILHLALPCDNHPQKSSAIKYATKLAEHLDYTGVLALEMFVTREGELYGNEFAPRVHNSGHWTMQGSKTDQFSQHLRAVTAQQFGSVATIKPTVMINQIGKTLQLDEDRDTKQHNYGKSARAARKLGHINLSKANDESLNDFANKIAKLYTQLYNHPLPDKFITTLEKSATFR